MKRLLIILGLNLVIYQDLKAAVVSKDHETEGLKPHRVPIATDRQREETKMSSLLGNIDLIRRRSQLNSQSLSLSRKSGRRMLQRLPVISDRKVIEPLQHTVSSNEYRKIKGPRRSRLPMLSYHTTEGSKVQNPSLVEDGKRKKLEQQPLSLISARVRRGSGLPNMTDILGGETGETKTLSLPVLEDHLGKEFTRQILLKDEHLETGRPKPSWLPVFQDSKNYRLEKQNLSFVSERLSDGTKTKFSVFPEHKNNKAKTRNLSVFLDCKNNNIKTRNLSMFQECITSHSKLQSTSKISYRLRNQPKLKNLFREGIRHKLHRLPLFSGGKRGIPQPQSLHVLNDHKTKESQSQTLYVPKDHETGKRKQSDLSEISHRKIRSPTVFSLPVFASRTTRDSEQSSPPMFNNRQSGRPKLQSQSVKTVAKKRSVDTNANIEDQAGGENSDYDEAEIYDPKKKVAEDHVKEPCNDYTIYPEAGICLYAGNVSVPYEEAQFICVDTNGELIKIKEEIYEKAVEHFLADKDSEKDARWIHMSFSTNKKFFAWDGESVEPTYQRWLDTKGHEDVSNKACVQRLHKGGYWTNTECDKKLKTICYQKHKETPTAQITITSYDKRPNTVFYGSRVKAQCTTSGSSKFGGIVFVMHKDNGTIHVIRSNDSEVFFNMSDAKRETSKQVEATISMAAPYNQPNIKLSCCPAIGGAAGSQCSEPESILIYHFTPTRPELSIDYINRGKLFYPNDPIEASCLAGGGHLSWAVVTPSFVVIWRMDSLGQPVPVLEHDNWKEKFVIHDAQITVKPKLVRIESTIIIKASWALNKSRIACFSHPVTTAEEARNLSDTLRAASLLFKIEKRILFHPKTPVLKVKYHGRKNLAKNGEDLESNCSASVGDEGVLFWKIVSKNLVNQWSVDIKGEVIVWIYEIDGVNATITAVSKTDPSKGPFISSILKLPASEDLKGAVIHCSTDKGGSDKLTVKTAALEIANVNLSQSGFPIPNGLVLMLIALGLLTLSVMAMVISHSSGNKGEDSDDENSSDGDLNNEDELEGVDIFNDYEAEQGEEPADSDGSDPDGSAPNEDNNEDSA